MGTRSNSGKKIWCAMLTTGHLKLAMSREEESSPLSMSVSPTAWLAKGFFCRAIKRSLIYEYIYKLLQH